MARKAWADLSPKYRRALERKGWTQASRDSGARVPLTHYRRSKAAATATQSAPAGPRASQVKWWQDRHNDLSQSPGGTAVERALREGASWEKIQANIRLRLKIRAENRKAYGDEWDTLFALEAYDDSFNYYN